MKIKSFEVGPFYENTYLLTLGNESLVVDPGFYSPSELTFFLESVKSLSTELIGVLLTHSHVDHVLGLNRLLKQFDIPVYLNTEDLFLWNNFGSQATMFGLNEIGFSFIPNALPTEGSFSIGSFNFECLYTPGHSPDHTAFYFEGDKLVIAGDALFKESIGRTDLYKGDFDLLERSIKEKLYMLPEETVVYPGHGPSTTVAHEKKNNPFVRP
ncbi:MAG: MBL fold metallo-hydrolase [Balneolales bacterium]|nr:MBL fold metallo-hydrolase [Balneolales bacterium]